MRALILAGGSGTRFWPLSRRDRPKQLLALDGERSLLQATVDRLDPLIPASDVWVCTTEHLAEPVREQLPGVPATQVLCEPEGRNTAPAIGWSLQLMAQVMEGSEKKGDDIVAVLPADHRFADAGAFRDALAAAASVAAETDRVMTLGVAPRWAETGYGYLELGEALEGSEALDGAVELDQFREKPDAATAEIYLSSGRHLWNAGIFVFRASTLMQHLRRHEPDIASGLDAMRAEPSRTAAIYADLPKISIDYAVMERLPADRAIAALRLDAGWSDLGSWQALSDELPEGDPTTGGNQTHGDVVAVDSEDNLLWAGEGTIAVAGVSGLVVVRTGDSVLVVPKEKSQDVKKIVDELKRQQRADRL